jgi:4-diphosphocytidyl-2-C-methyl-D-erythritol kinase
MVCFPYAKINLGLHILSKRPDGYHNLETCFYPVKEVCDVLEMIENTEESFEMEGADWPGAKEDNLVWKAYTAFRRAEPGCPSFSWYLHKKIPSGGGLGGGSSDAAFALRMLADFCGWEKQDTRLWQLAASLGSDCAYFLLDCPALGSSRGEVLEPVEIPEMNDYDIKLVLPEVKISTALAFSRVRPSIPDKGISSIIRQPVSTWRAELKNDFEDSVFPQFPQLQKYKNQLYDKGAVYVSMSGSGSALFGLFRKGGDAGLP